MIEADIGQYAVWALEKSKEDDSGFHFSNNDNKSYDTSDIASNKSSDRSSISSMSQDMDPEINEDGIPPHERGLASLLAPVQSIMRSLHQLSLNLRLAGAHHRHERITRLRSLDRYEKVFQTIRRLAYQKASHAFPAASDFILERIAESVAARGIRFLYFEQHQKKLSTLAQPPPILSTIGQQETPIHSATLGDGAVSSHSGILQDHQKYNLNTNENVSGLNTIISDTAPSRYKPEEIKTHQKRPDPVLSVEVSAGGFPAMPKIDDEAGSFTCPYCRLECLAQEKGHGVAGVSTEQAQEKQWQ